jgi:hypothetical protein
MKMNMTITLVAAVLAVVVAVALAGILDRDPALTVVLDLARYLHKGTL